MNKRMQLISLLSMSLLALTVAAEEPDPFYLLRLEAGKRAQAAERHFEAVPELRIASFGFLDNPAYLAEALARLAVAQQNAGLSDEAMKTLQRFVNVESVGLAYDASRLDRSVRTVFEDLLRTHIPPEIFGTIDSLQHLHVSAEQQIDRLPERERRDVLQESVRREPDNMKWYVLLIQDALARGSTREARRWAEQGLEVEPGNEELVAIRVNLLLAENDCVAAWDALSASARPNTVSVEQTFVCLVSGGDLDEARGALAYLENRGAELSTAGMKAREALVGTDRPDRPEAPPEEPMAVAETAAESSAAESAVTETRVTETRATEPPDSAPPPQETPSPGSRHDSPAEPTPLDSASRIARGIEESRRLLQAGQFTEAKQILHDLEQNEGASRDVHLALLETGVLSRDWNLARRQLSRVNPFRRSESIPIFYAAVTLYESGRYEEAQRLFQAARPRIGDGELVLRYERLIMGD